MLSGNTIMGNTATANGGGIVIYGEGRYAAVVYNTINGNTASNRGGGIFIDFADARVVENIISRNNLTGAGLGGGVYFGAQSTGIVRGNMISENTGVKGGGIYVDYSTGTLSDNTLARNTASGSGGALYLDDRFTGRTVTLSGNTMNGNTSPSSTVHWQDVHSNSSALSNNLLTNDSPYLVYNALPSTEPDANMENNWWGTTNDAEIQDNIYDWFDDPTKGFVDYTPFLNQPSTGAPVSPPMGLVAVGDADALTIDLTWTVNPESNVARYNVYYDTDQSGFPCDGADAAEGPSPIGVGNVTGFTLSGLTPWIPYYVVVTAIDVDGNESWYSQEEMVVLQPDVDTTPPYTEGHAPAKDAVGVPIDTDICLQIRDDDSRVEMASIGLSEEGLDVTAQSVITGTSANYTVCYDPPTDFGYGQVVDVRVDASDQAIPLNVMPTDNYSFTTLCPPAGD